MRLTLSRGHLWLVVSTSCVNWFTKKFNFFEGFNSTFLFGSTTKSLVFHTQCRQNFLCFLMYFFLSNWYKERMVLLLLDLNSYWRTSPKLLQLLSTCASPTSTATVSKTFDEVVKPSPARELSFPFDFSPPCFYLLTSMLALQLKVITIKRLQEQSLWLFVCSKGCEWCILR